MKNIRTVAYLLLGLLLATTACDEDDPTPVKVNFANSEAGISKDNPTTELEITFSRPAEFEGTLSINIANTSLTYGESADFYTTPAATDDIVTLPYAIGDQSVSVTITSGSALNIEQDESITLTITDNNEVLDLGNQTALTVVFSENYIAPSGTNVLDAGGATFTHQAFFDLSKIKQTRIDKFSWDLGFYSGESFRVIINNSAKMMAREIDKNDLTAVTAEDTLGFAATQNFGAFNGDAVDWVDAPDGNLDSLALNKVLVTATDNKVYIISREGDGRNWKKIRILQNGSGYTLQHADISSTTFESTDIAKDEAGNFSFFDLDNGTAQAEPAKDSWDIMYGSFTHVINFGYYLPYAFNDYVIINRNNTQIVEVLIDETVTYDGFGISDVAALTFETAQNTIGSNWRNGGGPGTAPSLKDDRFYVIIDSEGNTYKIRFTSMLSAENGERGYTEIQYELL